MMSADLQVDDEPEIISPQAGPQAAFLSTTADIAIYGGAAGGGKTFGLLLDPLRFSEVPGFDALILRNTSTQVRTQGGLWDTAEKLYRPLGAFVQESRLRFRFPSGATVKFGYLEYEKDKYNYHGSELAFIGFDELTQFSESQFFYLLSRNRSKSGIKPYVRATCNADADSWVASFISWWIDEETGFPIPERSGILRYFVRDSDRIVWGGSPEELRALIPGSIPKSVTFIPAYLDDNKILNKIDPGYRANLMSLSLVDRERLLGNNWKIRHTAGNVFRPEWFRLVRVAPDPSQVVRAVRYWDKAGSLTGDATAGGLVLFTDRYTLADLRHARLTPNERNKLIKQTAEMDYQVFGRKLTLWIEREPGHNATESTETLAKLLVAYAPRFDKVVKAKLARAVNLATAAESGIVDIVNASWTRTALDELQGFPEARHDDIVDAFSGSFNKLFTDPNTGARVAPSVKGMRK